MAEVPWISEDKTRHTQTEEPLQHASAFPYCWLHDYFSSHSWPSYSKWALRRLKKSPLPETWSFEMVFFFFSWLVWPFLSSHASWLLCILHSLFLPPPMNMLSPQVKVGDSSPMPDLESNQGVTALMLTLAHTLMSLANTWTGEGDAREDLEN